jgi:GrpB-like predicted nucleotidyltransferase (UPF0157 family)
MNPIPTGDEVVIFDYDPVWSKLFEEERARLAPAVVPFAISIEHVGSTSVPGLCAKPVVDMLLTVQRLEGPEPYVAALAPLGYVMRVDPANTERHAFGKRDARGRRIIPGYNFHVVEDGGTEQRCLIGFRDYRNGTRKPLGFSQWMHSLPLDDSRTHVLSYRAGETAKLAGETRSPHKPHTGCSNHLALLVTGRVPPECASASLDRWTGRLRRP